MSLELRYLKLQELTTHRTLARGRILGVIAFGKTPQSAPDYPAASIDLPLLNGDTVYEVWTSDEPVQYENSRGISSACNASFMFGCLQTEAGLSLEPMTREAYARIFDLIDLQKHPHLLRVWHYFPRINAMSSGLERYRQFNIGRHDAFVANERDIEADAPAASAIGSRSEPLVIYFLAASQRGQPVENPRQKSAYNYPSVYGPCSPTFSRAMFTKTLKNSFLFISGTASIVGDETQHLGQPIEQIRETIANLRAVIEEARAVGWDSSDPQNNLLLKVYLRDPTSLSPVKQAVADAFGPRAHAFYFQAEICRSNLLLEIEATCQAERRT